jgi:hypothetical protein
LIFRTEIAENPSRLVPVQFTKEDVMKSMKGRVLVGVAFLVAVASQALPYDRPTASGAQRSDITIAPVQCGGPKWIANVRLDAQGVIGSGGPHVQLLSTSAMGLSGAPSDQTAGGGTSIMLTVTVDDARAMGQALLDWADNPTDSVIFSRQRRYPAPPVVY